MCGACGEPATWDWARPFLAGLPARAAVAVAVTRRAVRPGPRIVARGGGWLVCAPTGVSTACAGLVELIAVARPWLGPPGWFRSAAPSGRVVAPGPDSRRGVRVSVDPAAQPGPSAVPSAGDGRQAEITVPNAAAALRVIAGLAAPPWSLRCFLADLSDVDDEWGRSPARIDVDTADRASDLLVWLECARQAGALDGTPIVARCPLDTDTDLDIEIRAGHVVRARPRRQG